MPEQDPPQEGTDNPQSDQSETTAPSYAEVLERLSDTERAAVAEEIRKKNSEARNQRDRAKSAEEKARLYDEAENARKTAEERALEAKTAAEDRYSQMIARVAAAEVRARASGRFADPEDAAAFLDTTRYTNEQGDVDTDAISADLDDLLSRKPHLAKPEPAQEAPAGPRRPAPDKSQGSSANGASRPSNVDAGRDLYRQRHPRSGVSTSF